MATKNSVNQPILTVKNVSKRFGEKQALHKVSFTVEPGKIVGLLGPNGSGKSTIIKTLNDLIVPDQGAVKINGEKPGVNSKNLISYLPERTYLDKSMTVKQALKMFGEFYADFDEAKAENLLKDLDLNKTQKIRTMSKGMQEKLQLVLVMSRRAKVYILDEPLGGVDPAARDHILDTILTNFEPGSSVLISTHLIADIERILDQVIFIRDGHILLQADADQLRAEHDASIDQIFRKEFRNV